MSKKRRISLILVAVAVILAASVAGAITVAERNMKAIVQIAIEDIDLAAVADGTYTGSYSSFPVTAQVDVTVQDHVITAIELVKHINGQGGDAEVIPQMVVDAQSLQVDAISGATYSSKVILLAIQDALQNAITE